MIQELFRIGPFAISPFGVLLGIAFVAGYFQLKWGLRRLGVWRLGRVGHVGQDVACLGQQHEIPSSARRMSGSG